MARVAVTRRRPIYELYSTAFQRTPRDGTVRTVGQTPTAKVSFYRSPDLATVRVVGQTPTVGFTHSVAPSVGTVRSVGQLSGTVTVSS